METRFLADFPSDREKSVSCQDIWGAQKTLCTSLMSSLVPACLMGLVEGVFTDFAVVYGCLLTAGRTISSPFDCSLSDKVSLKHSLPFHPEELMV